MPIYEYRCDNGHQFEVLQRMTDDPVESCTTCSASVGRVFHPIAVHFKGSGFYNTDYGKSKAAGSEETGSKEDGGGKGESSDKKEKAGASDSGSSASDSSSSGASSASTSGSSSSSTAGSSSAAGPRKRED